MEKYGERRKRSREKIILISHFRSHMKNLGKIIEVISPNFRRFRNKNGGERSEKWVKGEKSYEQVGNFGYFDGLCLVK